MRFSVNMRWIHYLVFILFIKNGMATSENPEVVTNVGVIRGLKASDGDYDMYMGIPYAHVNESNVWGESILQPPFQEVFEAYDDSARCPQIEEFNNTVTGSLDCLHLNVYVPRSASLSNPLPVLVWIYGGGFSIGFHGRYMYGPKYLVRHDIIFVTLNYRLGPFGFMCLDTPEIPGNQGLKDQVKALRWVRDNIATFGGDPDKVTIAGNSAGASSVELHLRSEFEQMYDKAILQSGNTMLGIFPADLEFPVRLAKAAGYETNDVNDALNFLANLSTDDVVLASRASFVINALCPEKEFPGVDRFISDYAYNLKMNNARNISFIIGNTDDEGATSLLAGISTNLFRQELQLTFNMSQIELEELSKFFRRFYIGDNGLDSDVFFEISDFYGDSRFYYLNEMISQEALDIGAARVYRYLFSYTGERDFAKYNLNITNGRGVYHADELGYLFDMEFFDEPNEDDQLTIDRMTMMWANFVKYGDPTPSTSELLPHKWLPITEKKSHYLELNKLIKTGTRPFNDRMAFWDLFYRKFKTHLNWYNKSDSRN